MTATTGSFAKFIFPSASKGFGLTYDEWGEMCTKVFEKQGSGSAFEEDVTLVGFGAAQEKSESDSIAYDDPSQGFVYRYTHTTMALGFKVSREAYDDLLGEAQAFKRAKALGFTMRNTKEVRAFNVLNRAFNSSYTFGDGKELCAADLPNFSGGTWRNELSVAADLSEQALEQALIDIGAFTTDRGLKVHVQSRMLIVPIALQFVATRILDSELQSGSGNNDTNAIRKMGMFPDGSMAVPYLTDTDAWFVKTNCPEGMKCYQRSETKFEIDNEFDTKNAKFSSTERYSFGCTDKRSIFGSPGAA